MGFKSVWNKLGHIYLTAGLFLLAIVALTLGYYQLKSSPELFYPLNALGFVKWAKTYGKTHPGQTAWLFCLVGIFALIAVNTFICTTERVVQLVRHRKNFRSNFRFLLKLSPHIMHYAILIMLLGYLISYLGTRTYLCNVLLPDRSYTIPESSCTITLEKLDIDYYEGKRLQYMENRAIRIDATLRLDTNRKSRTATLGFNRPVWVYPYTIHLEDFAPKSKGGMNRNQYIRVVIKKDPGVFCYFAGMLIFVLGLALYLVDRKIKIKGDEK